MTIRLIQNLQQLSHLGAIAVKTEFEAEGATFEEVRILKEITDVVGFDFVLKISGCEAIRDLKDAKALGIKNIVAPMIESKYAFKKFINSTSKTIPDAKLFINIETINGLSELDKILQANEAEKLSGIVFGRSDFAGSLDITDVEDKKIISAIKEISKKAYLHKKWFVIGGGITEQTLKTIKQIDFLPSVETRKIVFDASKLNEEGIRKALEFEINWLEYKQKFSYSPDDAFRLQILSNRLANKLN